MTMQDPGPPDIHIESIVFNPEGIQVSFMEQGRQSTLVGEVTTLMVAPEACEMELAEMLEAAVAFIEAALIAKRNPPDTIRSRRR